MEDTAATKKLTPTQAAAVAAIKADRNEALIWETHVPAVTTQGVTIAKRTLDALVRKGVLTVEHRGIHRESGRMHSWGAGGWSRGWSSTTLAYRLK